MKNKITNNHIKLLSFIAVIFVAFNLTSPFTTVGPLIEYIRTDLGMSHFMVSFVNTLPVLVIACFSPFASKIGNKIGNEISILAGLILLGLGLVFRSFGNITSLFTGTILLGIGVSTGFTLIPSILKKRFPNRVDQLTGIYAVSTTASAAVASAVSVPLAVGLNLGWRKSLFIWTAMVLIAIIFWIPLLKNNKNNDIASDAQKNEPFHGQNKELTFRKLLTLPLAWGVAIFMGLESFNFNGIITWMPAILQAHGMNIYTSGMMLSFCQIVSMPASFLTPLLSNKFKDQKGVAVISCCIYLLGFAGLLFAKSQILVILCLVLIGLGFGATYSLTIIFITNRASDPNNIALLNGMSQSVGCSVGALGPLSIGLLFDITKSWNVPIALFILVTIGLGFVGLIAGRNVYINSDGKVVNSH